jgi:hypothetical protein
VQVHPGIGVDSQMPDCWSQWSVVQGFQSPGQSASEMQPGPAGQSALQLAVVSPGSHSALPHT